MPHATQSGLRRDAAVHLQCTGHVAYRSPAPLTPLRNPTVVPGYSARPNQNAGDGSRRRLDAALNAARVTAGCGGALTVHWVCGIQVTLSSPPATKPYGCTQV